MDVDMGPPPRIAAGAPCGLHGTARGPRRREESDDPMIPNPPNPQAAPIPTEMRTDPVRGCPVACTPMRVRYAEIDRMGFAYNAHYLTWFEIGRSELMRALGLPYREVEDRGFHLPLVATAFTLRLPVRYDEVMITETWIAEVRSRAITFAYRLMRDGDVLAEGTTRHACLCARTGRAAGLPDWLTAVVRPGCARTEPRRSE